MTLSNAIRKRITELAKEKGIKNYSKMSKAELLKELDV